MAQSMEKIVDKLNDLVALDIDAVSAYQAAISRITVPFLRDRLREFQLDHERHVRDLSEFVVRYGGQPKHGLDVKGFLIKGFTAVTSMMGNEAALRAMQGNEQLTNRIYQTALSETWPDEVRKVVERNHADERRHLAFIQECLRTRLWDQSQPAQK